MPIVGDLLNQGYGRVNGVITKIITGGMFDDIICIIIFKVF